MLTTLIECYIHSPLSIPRSIRRPVLNALVALDHQLCIWAGGNYSAPVEDSDEIAAQSSELMSIHYDQPLPLFGHTLGKSMKYSMALWETGAGNLAEAQEAMMADFCAKAEIEDGQSVLDIGCGFGSFADYVLRHYPKCKVTALTMSKVQADYIAARQGEPGHALNSKHFQLLQEDFNKVRFKETFDRVVSIGVWEHVSNLEKAQAKVRNLLKAKGKVLLHYCTYFKPLRGITEKPLQSNFIAKHIFPAGRIWGDHDLYAHQKDLVIKQAWEMNGRNYERTLTCWIENLHTHYKTLLDHGLAPHSLKLWDFYFRLCAGVFHLKGGTCYGNTQYLLTPA